MPLAATAAAADGGPPAPAPPPPPAPPAAAAAARAAADAEELEGYRLACLDVAAAASELALLLRLPPHANIARVRNERV